MEIKHTWANLNKTQGRQSRGEVRDAGDSSIPKSRSLVNPGHKCDSTQVLWIQENSLKSSPIGVWGETKRTALWKEGRSDI